MRKPCLHKSKGSASKQATGFLVSKFDLDMAKVIRNSLIVNGVIIGKQHYMWTIKGIASRVFELRQRFAEDEIRETFDWLFNHWNDRYTPRLYRPDDVLKFRQFQDAKNRSISRGERTSANAKLFLMERLHGK